jgi:hypothetical protein
MQTRVIQSVNVDSISSAFIVQGKRDDGLWHVMSVFNENDVGSAVAAAQSLSDIGEDAFQSQAAVVSSFG